MVKNSQPDEDFDIFSAKIETSPEHGLIINSKSLSELEEFVNRFAVAAKLTWWELAVFGTYIATGQIASMDLKAEGSEGLYQWSHLCAELYKMHMQAQLEGSNIALAASESGLRSN